MKRLTLIFTMLAAMLFVVTACDDDGGSSGNNNTSAECGNLACEEGEDATSCPSDCGCGNGVLNQGEKCDGTNLGNSSCEDLGFAGGTLACDDTCHFDTSQCEQGGASCGNNIKEDGEDCDGSDLGTTTCEALGFDGGTLACDNACHFDTSQCEQQGGPECGNNVKEDGEDCDGNDLGTATCASLGHDSGTLACDGHCGYDESGCCDNGCTTEGEMRCNNNAVEECVQQASGCLDWQVADDCGANGEQCYDDNGSPACGPVSGNGDQCSAPIVLSSFPYTLSGTDFTADFADDADYSDATGCGTAHGVDAFFFIHLEPGDKLSVSESGSLDAVVRLIDTCDSSSAQCIESVDSGDSFTYDSSTAGDYIIVVEAWSSSPYSKAYDININVEHFEQVCDDGQDNDGDGKADCFDPDCFGKAGVCDTEDSSALCSDGQDNDGDGKADCADPDCFGMAGACDTETVCDDGSDNDNDGHVDCDDSDCAMAPDCQPVRGIWQDYTGSGTNVMDLVGAAIIFTPAASATNMYSWTTASATDYLVQPGTGDATMEIVFNSGDDATRVDFPASGLISSFTFFGNTYDWISVSDNGHITFGTVSSSWSNSYATFKYLPRIAPFMTDFDMTKGGTIYVDFFTDKVVVTWDSMVEYTYGTNTPDTASFQAVLYSNGEMKIYVKAASFRDDAIVGIINGGKTGDDYSDTVDFVPPPPPRINEVMYDTPFSGDAGEFVEIYGLPGDSLDGYTLVHLNGNGGSVIWEIDLTGYSLNSDGFFVIGDGTNIPNVDVAWDDFGINPSGALQNGPDALVLYTSWDATNATGNPMDGVIWETGAATSIYAEGNPAEGVFGNWNTSVSRYPDGVDTNNNASDFQYTLWATPGELNTTYPLIPDRSVYKRLDAWGMDGNLNTYPMTIPDNDATGITLHISTPSYAAGTIADVKVAVKIEHTYIGDLKLVLTSPGGQSVVLHDRTGGSNNDIVGVYGADLTVDDASGLGVFNGETISENDIWTLHVTDSANGDIGKVVDWTLYISRQ